MAKHAHRIMLHQHKTWRCMLPGCNYFVHRGLEFTIPGKMLNCWGCSDEFVATDESLLEEMPMCDMCKRGGGGAQNRVSDEEFEKRIELDIALGKAGVKTVEELPSSTRSLLRIRGILPPLPLETVKPTKPVEERKPTIEETMDEIEVYDPPDEE